MNFQNPPMFRTAPPKQKRYPPKGAAKVSCYFAPKYHVTFIQSIMLLSPQSIMLLSVKVSCYFYPRYHVTLPPSFAGFVFHFGRFTVFFGMCTDFFGAHARFFGVVSIGG